MTRPPLDLRLVSPAAAAWAAGAVLLGAPAGMGLLTAGLLVVAAGLARRRPGVAGALAAAAAVATVTALHVATLSAGPLPALARAQATVALQVQVTADPVAHAAKVSGSALADGSVTVRATALRVDSAGAAARVHTPVLILARGRRWSGLLPSQRLRVTGRLSPPQRGGDIAAVLFAEGSADDVSAPSWVQRVAGRVRAGLRDACNVLPAEPRGLLPGLVDGDISRMPVPLVDDFRTAGLTHLTAVSGANVAIVLAVVLGLARRLRVPARAAPLVGAVGLVAFVVLARPSPSVVRAAAMGGVVVIAMVRGRRGASLAALGAAVLVLLLVSPGLARSPGLALSVLATGALLVIAPRWRDRLARHLPPVLAEALAVAAAAQVVCAPVIAAIGGSVGLAAVPANLLAAPAVAPATVLGVAAAVVAPVAAPVATVLAWLGGLPTRWLVVVAHRAAAAPYATLPWPGGPAGGLALAAATVAVTFIARRRATRRVGLAGLAGAVLAASAGHVLAPGWPPPGWLFAVCDIGQGDALALRAGPRSAVVVDAGPDPRLVDRCLRDLHVEQVPLVVLTHFHADHVEGLPGVLRHRAVAEVEVGPLDEPPPEVRRVLAWAAAARVPVSRARIGEVRRAGPARWQVVGPGEVLHGTPSDPNNDSVVLLAEVEGVRLLLTGDVEPDAQQRLLSLPPSALQADVLKVPHHGSAHQEPAFLDAVHARLAIASVGAGNPTVTPRPAPSPACAATAPAPTAPTGTAASRSPGAADGCGPWRSTAPARPRRGRHERRFRPRSVRSLARGLPLPVVAGDARARRRGAARQPCRRPRRAGPRRPAGGHRAGGTRRRAWSARGAAVAVTVRQ